MSAGNALCSESGFKRNGIGTVGRAFLSNREDFEYTGANVPVKPLEIANIKDIDAQVIFMNLMLQAFERRDPIPAIAKGLVSLKNSSNVLLINIRLTRFL